MKTPERRHAAFLDLGTNSARLLLVRINPNGSYTVLSFQKEMIRLGAGEFHDQKLQPEPMDRAVRVCKNFADMARANGASEVVAVATSATREAKNKKLFIRRLEREAGIDLQVISGREEARLIYLGVASAIELGDRKALFIDIGGGSTEIIVGDATHHEYLASMRLGAVRLGMEHPGRFDGKVSSKVYRALKEQVSDNAVRVLQDLQRFSVNLAMGSSGTIENLAEIADQAIHKRPSPKDPVLTRRDLDQVVELLCSLNLEERRKVKGINPARADIIIAGAAILQTLMERLDLPEIWVSDRGLKEGLLIDYLGKTNLVPLVKEPSARERSVLQLGRNCRFDEPHALAVARLALELFDSGRAAGLHALGEEERELLRHAAMLHDIGSFLSYTNHHAHTYYFIRNADLLGFSEEDLGIMAATALFHRKTLPRKKHPEFAALSGRSQEIVRVLCIMLRLAESLDRSHQEVIKEAAFRPGEGKKVVLELKADGAADLEIWGARKHYPAFKKTFNRPVEEQVIKV